MDFRRQMGKRLRKQEKRATIVPAAGQGQVGILWNKALENGQAEMPPANNGKDV